MCLNMIDTLFLPVLYLIHSSLPMSNLTSGWNDFKKRHHVFFPL